MADREIVIAVANECQKCNLMQFNSYNYDMLPYCTLFKTFLPFKEDEDDNIVVQPCHECFKCSEGDTDNFITSWE